MNAQAQFVLALLSTDLTGGQRPKLAVPICEELFGTLAIERAEGIDFLLNDAQIAPYAENWDALLQEGYEALCAKAWEDHQVVRPSSGVGDIHVHHLSWWGASKLFQIEDVVAELGLACRYGVLFSVPDIHTLHVHELAGPEAVPTAGHMVAYATYGFDQAEHGLSPDLFFFRDGTVQKVSTPGPDGRPSVADMAGLFAESYAECLREARGAQWIRPESTAPGAEESPAPSERVAGEETGDGAKPPPGPAAPASSASVPAAPASSAPVPAAPASSGPAGDAGQWAAFAGQQESEVRDEADRQWTELEGIRTVILADLRGRGLVVAETTDPMVVLIDGRRLAFGAVAEAFAEYPSEQWAIVVASWADSQVPAVLGDR